MLQWKARFAVVVGVASLAAAAFGSLGDFFVHLGW
jgi:hypothetical protein